MANTFKYYNATCKHKTAFKKNIYIFLNILIYVICDTCTVCGILYTDTDTVYIHTCMWPHMYFFNWC